MQSSRFGFFRAGYVATGIYAASTAKRVASQKSPCKNEERSKEEDEEENGERYRLKTVKSGSTKPRSVGEATLAFLFRSLRLLDAQSDKRRMHEKREEKRVANRRSGSFASPVR